jgi:voltage-gated potassium channel
MIRAVRERLLRAILILASALFIGTLGYSLVEGWPLFDALYMTVITVGTIGYGEVHPLSPPGRVFTIFLILGGLGAVGYAFSSVTAFFVEGELQDVLRRRKMRSRISALKDHFIVCGAGNTGRTIIEELDTTQRPFAIVELREDLAKSFEEKGWIVLQGDALSDDVLLEAGIERARGLFCALPDDKDNSFVAISARGLNPRLRVVSELHQEGVRQKLLRSGADAVVSSDRIGGLRMASEMIRPVTVGFLDAMMRGRGPAFRFDEVPVPQGSRLAGDPVGSIKGSDPSCALVVAVKSGEDYRMNPPADMPVASGDVLVVLGDPGQLSRIRERLSA